MMLAMVGRGLTAAVRRCGPGKSDGCRIGDHGAIAKTGMLSPFWVCRASQRNDAIPTPYHFTLIQHSGVSSEQKDEK